MIDDKEKIELLYRCNSRLEDIVRELYLKLDQEKEDRDKEFKKVLRLKRENECRDEELKKALAERDHYKTLYEIGRSGTRAYYWAGLTILAIVAAAAVMKILR